MSGNGLTTLPSGLFDNNPELGLKSTSRQQPDLPACRALRPQSELASEPRPRFYVVDNRNLSDLPDGFFANNPRLASGSYNGNASGFEDRLKPAAAAGADLTAHAGETVVLDASASTSRVFGANVTHVWRQSDTTARRPP